MFGWLGNWDGREAWVVGVRAAGMGGKAWVVHVSFSSPTNSPGDYCFRNPVSGRQQTTL